jgi:hypothetical protein
MKKEFQKANLFELSGGSIQVTYTTSGLEGIPLFSYRDSNVNIQYSGTEIKGEQTEIGEVLTVMLKQIPDSLTVTFSLILPVVNVLPGSAGSQIQVLGVTTTTHTSIAGSVPGAAKTYSVEKLQGLAQAVTS